MRLLLFHLMYVLWSKTREIRLSKSEEVSNHFIQQLKCINFIMKVSQININQNLIDKVLNYESD